MKKTVKYIVLAFVAIALSACKGREFTEIYVDDAKSAIVYYDGFVPGEGDLYKYTLYLDGVLGDKHQDFSLELSLYNLYMDVLPADYFYGSNYFGEDVMLYGKGGVGSYMHLWDSASEDWISYPIDGGHVDIKAYQERDGFFSYDIKARVYSMDTKYEIRYVGRPEYRD